MNYYLGFDAGTQSVKVAVYDEDMNCIVSSSAPTTLTYPEPGWVSMDVDEYLALTIKGMKECASQMKEKGLDVTKIKSIMGDGVICGICGVDKDGNAITPYINYLDSRTKEDVELVNSWDLDIFGKETGNPEANCMFPAMFARWFLKNIEGFKENGAKFIHDAPYVLAHLAGLSAKDMFVDWGTMSGWGLGYKVEEKCWSKEQLDILGIPEEMMPRIVKPWDIIGHLTEEIAQKTGLPAGIRDICKRNRIETRNPNLCGSRRYDAVHDRKRQYGTGTGSRRSRNLFHVLCIHKGNHSRTKQKRSRTCI